MPLHNRWDWLIKFPSCYPVKKFINQGPVLQRLSLFGTCKTHTTIRGHSKRNPKWFYIIVRQTVRRHLKIQVNCLKVVGLQVKDWGPGKTYLRSVKIEAVSFDYSRYNSDTSLVPHIDIIKFLWKFVKFVKNLENSCERFLSLIQLWASFSRLHVLLTLIVLFVMQIQCHTLLYWFRP